jgi:hypothetical protein
MEWSSEQILVEVAIIQTSTLNTEADKGSKTTVFVLGLVDPKGQGNSVNCGWPQGRFDDRDHSGSKGKPVKILVLGSLIWPQGTIFEMPAGVRKGVLSSRYGRSSVE